MTPRRGLMIPIEQIPETFNITYLSKILGRHRLTVARWTKEKELPCTRISHKTVSIDKQDFLNWWNSFSDFR